MTTIGSNIRARLEKTSCASDLNSVEKVGSGQYGVVYKAKLNVSNQRRFAIKESANNLKAEYNLTKKFISIVGKNKAAEVYAYEMCDRTKNGRLTRMYSEYLEGKTLLKFLPTLKKNPEAIKSIVIQVLTILRTISKTRPDFRHNDLHLDNIYITNNGTKVKIIDFGLATNKEIVNPEINKAKNGGESLRMYGIFRGNHIMYDTHFFLNSLHYSSTYLDAETIKFIEAVLPKIYLGSVSSVIRENRLRPIPHTNLPSFSTIFKHPYISQEKPANRVGNFINSIKKPSSKVKRISRPKPVAIPTATSMSMSAKMRAATAAFAKTKETKQKRPGASSKKIPASPESMSAIMSKTKEAPKKRPGTPSKKITPQPTLTKTNAKPMSKTKVSSAFIKNFMKDMARPKSNLRKYNI